MPGSGYLFLLCAEILVIQVKNNNRIKGIEINNNNEVLSQFADDTGIFSLYDLDSLQAILNTFQDFTSSTGLKVNFDKSVIYPIGKKNNQNLNVSQNFK